MGTGVGDVTWTGLIDLLGRNFTILTIFNDTVMSIDAKLITILLIF